MLEPLPLVAAEDALRRSMLRHWPRYVDLRVTHERIPLHRIATVIPVASARRARAAEGLLSSYLENGTAPYVPVRISEVAGGGHRVLFSPIVEAYGAELVLLDGMHRCLAALRSRTETITVALVRPRRAPAPVGPRLALDDVVYSRPTEEPPPVFHGRGYENYRPGALFVQTAARLLDQRHRPPLRHREGSL